MENAPNWEAIKAEFIAGTSQHRLAEKYGVTRSAIAKRSQTGEWMKYRNECRNKTSQKVAEMISDKRAELADRATELGSRVLKLSERILDRLEQSGISKASVDGTEVDMLKTVQAYTMIAKSLGIDEESKANRERIQLEREKLQIERERTTAAGTDEMPTIVINLGNDDQRE